MDFGKPGWLAELLDAAVTAHAPDQASASLAGARSLPPSRGRARFYLRGVLRESGLLYGTPKATAGARQEPRRAAEEVLFLAVLRTFARIALRSEERRVGKECRL